MLKVPQPILPAFICCLLALITGCDNNAVRPSNAPLNRKAFPEAATIDTPQIIPAGTLPCRPGGTFRPTVSLISDETIHYDRYESHKQPLRVFNDFGAFLQAFGADLRVDSFPTFCLCMDPDATNLIPRMLRAIDSLGLKAEVMSGDDGLEEW